MASGYTKAGKRNSLTWADGYVIAYTYDELGRMVTASEGATELARYCYDTIGRRTYLLYSATSANCASGTGTANKIGYTYEADSDLDVLTNSLDTTTVTMDFGRNKSHQITSNVVSDAFYLAKPAAKATAYVPNALNQYDSIGGMDKPATYDANGNMLTWVGSGGTNTYAYDSENRLVSAAVNGASSPTVTYDYDGLGRRVSKTITATSTTTSYLLDGDEEIAEYSGSTVLRRYIAGPAIDERIAFTDGSATPVKTYYHVNHQGSVVALTDSAGVVSERIGYNEYGLENPLCTGTGSAFRYTGRRFDAETCLYYYRARYYSPQIGSFLQVDPIGQKDDTNLYAYVNSDPLNKTDPTGKAGLIIAFPNYLADTETKLGKQRIGHAGVVAINEKTGRYRYYQFGRYGGTKGTVQAPLSGTLKMKDGKPTEKSMTSLINTLSKRFGQGGRAEVAYFNDADSKQMSQFADPKVGKTGEDKDSYGDWGLWNSCITFAEDTIDAGGGDVDSQLSPFPAVRVKWDQVTSDDAFSYDNESKKLDGYSPEK